MRTADSFYVDLFIDEETAPLPGQWGDYAHYVYMLESGESAFAYFTDWQWCGDCSTHAVVDSDEWVEESDETNNRAQINQ